MRVLYHFPHYKTTIYGYRTIVNGFKNAFEDMGHEFVIYTADDNLKDLLYKFQPNIFMTQTHPLYRRYLDLKLLKIYRNKGLKVFAKIDFWKTTLSKTRLNEAKGLGEDKKLISLIKNGEMADYFYHVVEQGDPRMDGFEKETGYKFHTIPLAADKIVLENSRISRRFQTDISFIGTNLPDKKEYFKQNIFPLLDKYKYNFYGQDWTFQDKALGFIQRGGQYFNIPYLRSIQKPKLSLNDEGNIYASSTISINVHEEYQRRFGGDCNERTFKIPMARGFEITDNVACIRKYFKVGQDIIVADNKDDWKEKIEYFMKNKENRIKIIESGRKKVLSDHTYHNRVNVILEIITKS